ncbi:MAG: hypothetical protein SOZ27_08010 [Spirochaetia bacterium]|nr:hypothetical protein [Spirochaetia bacterium]
MRYTGFEAIDSVEEYRDTALKAIDLFQSSQQEDALCYFERLREVNPENSVIAEVLTYLYTQMGMAEEADKEFARYCDLMRARGRYIIFDQPQTWEELVIEAKKDKKLKSTVKNILNRKEKSENPIEDIEKVSMQGVIYMNNGKYAEAEALFLEYREMYIRDFGGGRRIIPLYSETVSD